MFGPILDKFLMLLMVPVFIVCYPIYGLMRLLANAKSERAKPHCPNCGKKTLGFSWGYYGDDGDYSVHHCFDPQCGGIAEKTSLTGEKLEEVRASYQEKRRSWDQHGTVKPLGDVLEYDLCTNKSVQ